MQFDALIVRVLSCARRRGGNHPRTEHGHPTELCAFILVVRSLLRQSRARRTNNTSRCSRRVDPRLTVEMLLGQSFVCRYILQTRIKLLSSGLTQHARCKMTGACLVPTCNQSVAPRLVASSSPTPLPFPTRAEAGGSGRQQLGRVQRPAGSLRNLRLRGRSGACQLGGAHGGGGQAGRPVLGARGRPRQPGRGGGQQGGQVCALRAAQEDPGVPGVPVSTH